MRVHFKDITESTNIDARAGRHGDVFAADFQTAGRGRLDHRWESSAGLNLMFSAVFDAAGAPPSEVATYPLVAGLSVAHAIADLMPPLTPSITIKWPNDVLADSRKLAGLLCERNGDMVIAGIGINVNQRDFPPSIADRATSLAALCGRDFDRRDVLDAILAELYAAHSRWRRDGFAAFHPAFAVIDHLKGRQVSVRQTDSDPAPVSGICAGVQADGALLVGGVRIYAGEAHVEKCD